MRRPAARSPAIRSRAGPTSPWSTGAARRSACRPGSSNDADAAGLAEALFGAGRGHRVVFYITVGSGIGGALVVDGRVYSRRARHRLRDRPLAARAWMPTIRTRRSSRSASGFGIAAAGRSWLAAGELSTIRPPPIYWPAAAAGSNSSAAGWSSKRPRPATRRQRRIFARALQTLGWAIAQMITLVAPQVVVIGGGVPLAGEAMFFAPLRQQVARYVFPPLAHSYSIVPAALGEEVVVHGALAVAERALTRCHLSALIFLSIVRGELHSVNTPSSMSELRTATRSGRLSLKTAMVTRPIAVSAQSTGPSH